MSLLRDGPDISEPSEESSQPKVRPYEEKYQWKDNAEQVLENERE